MKAIARFILAGCSALVVCTGCQEAPPFNETEVLHTLHDGLLEAVVQDGFSPPVSSRIYAYTSIAAYEASILGNDTMVSLVGQLKGLDSLPPRDASANYVNAVIMVQAFSDVARSMVYRDFIIDQYQEKLFVALHEQFTDEEAFERSVQYGKTLGAALQAWAATDSYGATRNMPKFIASTKEGDWVPTSPKYMEALEPHWTKVRPFVLDSVPQFRMAVPFTYSHDTSSAYYAMARMVIEKAKSVDEDKMNLIKFWDDNPSPVTIDGHVMTTNRQNTPGGHWMCIARQTCQHHKLSLPATCEVLAKVSIALADAFKVAWDTKYIANNVRPVTYITTWIDPNWSPILETPNFPEYTSGHSAISAAAAEVLTASFGDTYSFTDSCNVPFGYAPRHFQSFRAAAAEAAISRVYGGIHYDISCHDGAVQGQKVGALVLSTLRTQAQQH